LYRRNSDEPVRILTQHFVFKITQNILNLALVILNTLYKKDESILATPSSVMIFITDSVGIATRYGLDGSGIESRKGGGGRDFPHPSRPALGSTQTPVPWIPALSRGHTA
jgi:hypothetical protein